MHPECSQSAAQHSTIAAVILNLAGLARNVNRKYSVSPDFNYEARMVIARDSGWGKGVRTGGGNGLAQGRRVGASS